ncbi:hypothetical protein MHBO_004291 [Bonamia ostreae]|uniref:Amino acid transporter n=1 Tax=Bonamia ostreae TaxID=126728 RepID=A0ABV2ASX2_9EUKA
MSIRNFSQKVLNGVHNQFIYPHEATQTLLSIVMSIGLGLFTRQCNIPKHLFSFFGMIGTVYLNLLQVLIVFYMPTKIICASFKMAKARNIFRILLLTVFLFFLSSLVMSALSLLVILGLLPHILPLSDDEIKESLSGMAKYSIKESMLGIFRRAFPDNYVVAAKNNNIVAITIFSVLFGISMSRKLKSLKLVKGENIDNCKKYFELADDVFGEIIDLIIKYTPLGIFSVIFVQILEINDMTVFLELSMLALGYLACFYFDYFFI